jgi:hypothetical protein
MMAGAFEMKIIITRIGKATIMTTRYTIDTDLDTIPLAELKKLALIALKVHETDRKKSKAYYERNRNACIARSTQAYERRKAVIAAKRAAELQETQGEFDFPGEIEFPGEEEF